MKSFVAIIAIFVLFGTAGYIENSDIGIVPMILLCFVPLSVLGYIIISNGDNLP